LTMELNLVFATPVAKFDASEFLEYGRSLFDGQIKTSSAHESGNLLTSLKINVNNDMLAEPLPNDEALKDFICKSTKEFAAAFGYDASLYDFSVYCIWINKMKSNSVSAKHDHYGSNFSGCFYVDIPKNSGGITFFGPLSRFDRARVNIKEHTIFNSHQWSIQPNEGDLYIWESYLQHQVTHDEFKGTRCSIAFDVKLNLKDKS